MHLSLERLMSTVVLLSITMAIAPGFLTMPPSGEQTFSSLDGILAVILRVWIADIVAVSLSVDNVVLSLSVIPFLCIFPVALVIGLSDYEKLMRIMGLTALSIITISTRFIANLM